MTKHPHPAAVAPAPLAVDRPTDIVTTASYQLPVIDPHGFDTSEYDWVPVRRKARSDGWSNAKQREFIGHLADEGSVTNAARAVGMSVQSCYRLRRAPGAENFARAWDAAIGEAGKRLLDVAFERAMIGADEPVFDKDGQVVVRLNRPSDRMLIFLLRTKLGDRLSLVQGADSGEQPARTADPLALPSVAQALIELAPAPPVAPPHIAMTPEALGDAIEIADLCDGELPHWHRDRPVEAFVPLGRFVPASEPRPSPLGAAFDQLLEAHKSDLHNGIRSRKRRKA